MFPRESGGPEPSSAALVALDPRFREGTGGWGGGARHFAGVLRSVNGALVAMPLMIVWMR